MIKEFNEEFKKNYVISKYSELNNKNVPYFLNKCYYLYDYGNALLNKEPSIIMIKDINDCFSIVLASIASNTTLYIKDMGYFCDPVKFFKHVHNFLVYYLDLFLYQTYIYSPRRKRFSKNNPKAKKLFELYNKLDNFLFDIFNTHFHIKNISKIENYPDIELIFQQASRYAELRNLIEFHNENN